MFNFTLTGAKSRAPDKSNPIFCPSLVGLSPTQADLAFAMPRINHNQVLLDTPCQGYWAAVLASDPFGSELALFEALSQHGYEGVVNWPSSILLDASFELAMRTVSASPLHEYQFLTRAMNSGLKAKAFFRSYSQAKTAIDVGLRNLILHPGIVDQSNINGKLVRSSLNQLLDRLYAEEPDLSFWVYTSKYHEPLLELESLPVEGAIWYEEQDE